MAVNIETHDTHLQHPALQHHFDNMEQQKEAGTIGMWMFLVQEIMFFGGMFLVYLLFRSKYPMAFAAGSNHLDLWLGLTNTIVLIVSSLTMALAVRAAQTSEPTRHGPSKRNLQVLLILVTMLLGGVFLGIKAIEYHQKYEDHLIPFAPFTFKWEHKDEKHKEEELKLIEEHGSAAEKAMVAENYEKFGDKVQIYFWIYFCMTGLHALHMIIGIGLMAWLAYTAWRGYYSSEYYAPVEISGLYWHFVDIVWIFLFPLLYLLGRHFHV
jgi:cytochrome c oxidase subunit 3